MIWGYLGHHGITEAVDAGAGAVANATCVPQTGPAVNQVEPFLLNLHPGQQRSLVAEKKNIVAFPSVWNDGPKVSSPRRMSTRTHPQIVIICLLKV